MRQNKSNIEMQLDKLKKEMALLDWILVQTNKPYKEEKTQEEI